MNSGFKIEESYVRIPEGSFLMGDPYHEGQQGEIPQRNQHIKDFFIAKYPVTLKEFRCVFDWATQNGYDFDHSGLAWGESHPVHSIYWYDAVKWCNAKSEREKRQPVYYSNEEKTEIYRKGRIDLLYSMVLWEANGFRLPTEPEWERAARGGLENKRFPWGDFITHNDANYFSSDKIPYDQSKTREAHPFYKGTSPVGSFPPNGYGLYDMAGNIFQWCWNWFVPDYNIDSIKNSDPTNDRLIKARSIRGGDWKSGAENARCSSNKMEHVCSYYDHIGFRPVFRMKGAESSD